jgi:hypothetical protein
LQGISVAVPPIAVTVVVAAPPGWKVPRVVLSEIGALPDDTVMIVVDVPSAVTAAGVAVSAIEMGWAEDEPLSDLEQPIEPASSAAQTKSADPSLWGISSSWLPSDPSSELTQEGPAVN